MREKQSYKTKYRGKILYISSKKNKNRRHLSRVPSIFWFQKGLMGQPLKVHINNLGIVVRMYVLVRSVCVFYGN
ncbi:hypothetical protein SAGV69_04051 [Staphylococcus aureus]|nr:hypothetical protein SAGV69_04051 [Staphylococcus aureus]